MWKLKADVYLCVLEDIFPELVQVRKDLGLFCPQSEAIKQNARGLDWPVFVDTFAAQAKQNPVLTHPLNGSSFVSDKFDLNSAFTFLKQEIENQYCLSKDNYRVFFYRLWRVLPCLLQQKDKQSGLNWLCLPAHFALPFASVWQRAAIASALASAGDNPALLIFTIASVQEFVTTARRTQDAWAGSFLLSYLAWNASQVIASVCGPDVFISPDLKGQPLCDFWLEKETGISIPDIQPDEKMARMEIASIPNIFSVIVPAEKAQELALEARKQVQDAWQRIASRVYAGLEHALSPQEQIDSLWKRQIDDFVPSLGLFWSICFFGEHAKEIFNKQKENVLTQDAPPEVQNVIKYIETVGPDSMSARTAEKIKPLHIYPLASALAGQTMTTRKNLRDFLQCPEPGFKCSLCGKREALHPKNNTSAQAIRVFWDRISKLDRTDTSLKLAGRIRKGERLCAVCLVKRLALEGFFESEMGIDRHMFPSTASIACMSFRSELLDRLTEDNLLRDKAQKYCTAMTSFLKKNNIFYQAADGCLRKSRAVSQCKEWIKDFLHLDGQWFYPEALASKETIISRTGATNLKGNFNQCQSYLIDLINHIKKYHQDMEHLSPYYAIVAIDGDKMGDWIRGKNFPDLRRLFHPEIQQDVIAAQYLITEIKALATPAMQQNLSSCLKNFVFSHARQIVEDQCRGKLIYAGGDDLLAFLPLSKLLLCLEKLHNKFHGQNGWGENGLCLPGGYTFETTGSNGMTFSAGIVIAHYSHPLWHSLTQAQEVLKHIAKKKLGRDAFAIRILKRAGETTETGCKFVVSYEGKIIAILPLLQKIISFMQSDLSSRVGNVLASQIWAEENNYFGDKLNEARRCELKRILKQHIKNKNKSDEISSEILKLFDLLLCMSNPEKTHNNVSMSVEFDPWLTLVEILLLLRFLSGQED